MHNSTPVIYSVPDESTDIQERFRKAQAEYRSQGIMAPSEWPMNSAAGREAYRRSISRHRFLRSIDRQPLQSTAGGAN